MIARDFLPRLIELAVDQSIGTIRFRGISCGCLTIAAEGDMISPDAVANEILRKVVAFVKNGDRLQLLALHTFPVAIYVTDIDGFIT
jgi:hypothetical protein